MMYAADFREQAREALKGNWGLAVGAGFVAALLGAGTITVGGSGGSIDIDLEELESLANYTESEEAIMLLWGIVGGSLIISLLFGIFHLVVGGAATLGYVKFNFNLLNKNGEVQFSDLFSQFHRLGTGIGMQLLRWIYITLWSLLFIIPGIIKGYSYAMTPYILLENPNMSANEAITESRKLMDGNKWRLFCLGFSFIGWSYLSVFSCGIGYLWLIPYQEAAYAAFYREIKREKYGEPEVVEPADAVEATEAETYEEMMNNRYREPEYRDMSAYEIVEEKNGNTDEN